MKPWRNVLKIYFCLFFFLNNSNERGHARGSLRVSASNKTLLSSRRELEDGAAAAATLAAEPEKAPAAEPSPPGARRRRHRRRGSSRPALPYFCLIWEAKLQVSAWSVYTDVQSKKEERFYAYDSFSISTNTRPTFQEREWFGTSELRTMVTVY